MALPSTVYRATIQLSHVDRGIYETIQATLARHPSETAERLVLRLLAYAVCYGPELAFTKGVGIAWDLTISGDTIYVTSAGVSLDAPLERLAGPALSDD